MPIPSDNGDLTLWDMCAQVDQRSGLLVITQLTGAARAVLAGILSRDPRPFVEGTTVNVRLSGAEL
eukprot:1828123-Prorocentrum_lima.AAC.1